MGLNFGGLTATSKNRLKMGENGGAIGRGVVLCIANYWQNKKKEGNGGIKSRKRVRGGKDACFTY